MVTDVLDPDALSWTNHHRSLSFMCFRFVLNYVPWSYIFRRASSYISLDFVVIAFIITVRSWFAVSLVDAFFNVLTRFMETFCLEINIDRLLLETACYSNHCNRKVWRMKSNDNSRHFSAYSNWVQFSAYQISFWIDNLVADFIEEANTVARECNSFTLLRYEDKCFKGNCSSVRSTTHIEDPTAPSSAVQPQVITLHEPGLHTPSLDLIKWLHLVSLQN